MPGGAGSAVGPCCQPEEERRRMVIGVTSGAGQQRRRGSVLGLETWRGFAAHPSWSLAGVFMLENLLYFESIVYLFYL